MDKIKQIGAAALIAALLGGLSACDQMSTRQRDTALGAGVGGVAGAALVVWIGLWIRRRARRKATA